jgi:hypothetical protein
MISVTDLFRKWLPTPPRFANPIQMLLRRHHWLVHWSPCLRENVHYNHGRIYCETFIINIQSQMNNTNC